MLDKCLLFIKQTLKPLSFQMCVVPTQGRPGSQGTEAGRVSLYLQFERKAQHFSCLQKNANICLWSSLRVATAVCYCRTQPLAAKTERPLVPQHADFPCSQFQTELSSANVSSYSSTNCHVAPSFFNLWPRLFFSAVIFLSLVNDVRFYSFISTFFSFAHI